jgi:hypothetical protein
VVTQERRETFIALRATHAAHRIASAVRDAEPIDVHSGYCRACGAGLDLRDNVNGVTTCTECGAAVRVPPYATVWGPVPRTDDEAPRSSREELILAAIDVIRARPAPTRHAPSPWRDLGVVLSVLGTVGSAIVGGMFVLAWVCR